MKNKKRTIVLALAGLLSAGALTGVAVESFGGGLANVFAADNEDSYIWNHYAAVAPTVNRHGSKEFWANCSVLGQVVFEKPTKGTINEGHAFETTDYFEKLESGDPRYVAPLESEIITKLTTENVTFVQNEGASHMSFDGAFDQMAYQDGVVYGLRNQLLAEFGGSSRANDGIFVVTETSSTTYTDCSMNLPAINFKNELSRGGVISMEFGCRTGQGYIKFKDKKIQDNASYSSALMSSLTQMRAYFYLDDKNNVKVSFISLERDPANTTYSSYLRKEAVFELSPDEANGVSGLVFKLGANNNNRHYWFSHPSLVNQKQFRTPGRPTRPADTYYQSYSFGGWYSDSGKYDFSTEITESERFTPRWIVGKETPFYLKDSVLKWSTSEFTFGGTKDTRMINCAGALAVDVWGKSDADKKSLTDSFNKNCSILNVNDETGIFFRAGGKAGWTELPKMNFSTLIPQGKKLFMYFGTFLNNNSLLVNCGGQNKNLIRTTNSEMGYNYLTKTLVSFYKDSYNKVHMSCDDLSVDKFQAADEYMIRAWDVILTDGQANGSESLKLTTAQDGSNRNYWIGKPFIYQDNDIVLDVVNGGVSAVNGEVRTKTVTNNNKNQAPNGQWFDNISGESDAVGVYGNVPNKAGEITFNHVNFAEQFAQSKGVKFTIGVWNGNETIYFKHGSDYVDLGKAHLKQNLPEDNQPNYYLPKNYTRKIVEDTWFNWQATVDKFDGLTIYNQNTEQTFKLPLTADQLDGTESISFKLTNNYVNGRFFYISNMTSYQY